MAIHMFQQLIDTLKKSPKRIVFTEGTDARILEASARLLAGTWLAPILIGNEAEVKAAAEEVGFNIRGAEIIDPATYPDMDKMVEEMVALRRGKMTADECRAALMKGNYFGTMLVKMGVADCLLGGATYSTADTVRPALQLIKTKPEELHLQCYPDSGRHHRAGPGHLPLLLRLHGRLRSGHSGQLPRQEAAELHHQEPI